MTAAPPMKSCKKVIRVSTDLIRGAKGRPLARLIGFSGLLATAAPHRHGAYSIARGRFVAQTLATAPLSHRSSSSVSTPETIAETTFVVCAF